MPYLRFARAACLALVLACSSDGKPRTGADDDPSQGTPDDEDDGAGGDDDPGDGSDGEPGDFDECAEARFDGELGRRAGNIVWVIDTSGSMEEEASQVQQNMNAFVAAIVGAGLEDYRVVVVSEPEYVSVPDPLGSDDAHFRYVQEEVDSNEPLQDLLARFPDYADFLLDGVVTHFVVVTDDESDIPADAFVTEMRSRLMGELRVHAIASPPGAEPPPNDGDDDDDDDSGCTGPNGDAAAPGVEHYRAAELTEGLQFSICTEDWSGLFGELAREVGASAPLPCELGVPQPEAGATLDPTLVNVLFTAPGSTDEVAFPRVDDASACGQRTAWYYDDPAAPATIQLCPAACDVVAEGGALDVALGCRTVLE